MDLESDHVEGLYLDILRIFAPYFQSNMGAGRNAKAMNPNREVAHWVFSFISSRSIRGNALELTPSLLYMGMANSGNPPPNSDRITIVPDRAEFALMR